MSAKKCGLCGADPAIGFAGIDGVRYCHGDFEPDPTCYMQASWLKSLRAPKKPESAAAQSGEETTT